MDRLHRYLSRGAKRVHGWLDPYSAAFTANLAGIQTANGIQGSVGEIGVHMGRLFILLKLLAGPNEKCFAIDVFDDQHLNTDKSGSGDREIFLANVARWTGNADLAVIQSSSLDVKPADITRAAGPCRLVSIDGGHTETCVIHDLELIEAVLVVAGVVVLDDFFHPSWPGVAAGASRFFLDPATELRPFAITPNKMYLARVSAHQFYRAAIRETQSYYFEKTVELFGHEVDVLGCDAWTFSMLRRLKVSPLGPYLVAAKANLLTLLANSPLRARLGIR